ncbi:RNA exonuclease [Nematocida major]|uniref:RNA exonuclease n=1 Tax=Nematocida major TaxID=1912982 RepID=UPI002007336B|nr:RNA exonuclease [Nematocida major]KAH9387009.1 RNA exonuclease [Nematocida major]
MGKNEPFQDLPEKHAQISLEKLQKFVSACRTRKNTSSLAEKFCASTVCRILVVISSEAAVLPEPQKAGGEYVAVLRESPLPEDFPVFLHSTRSKTEELSLPLESALSKKITAETVSKYLVKDLSTVYTDGIDHRIYTIPSEERAAFYSRHSSEGTLSQVSSLKPLTITEIPWKKEAEEHVYYDVVRVNEREMVTYKATSPHSILSVDCEMVSTDLGTEVARVSFVSEKKDVVYDQTVEPVGAVVDYLTEISGISEDTYKAKCACKRCMAFKNSELLALEEKHSGSISYEMMLFDFSFILGENTTLVGHSISHDLFSMNVFHRKLIDTSLLYNSKTHHRYKLKSLANSHLKREIQGASHSSIVDAEACIDLLKCLPPKEGSSALKFSKTKNLSISTEFPREKSAKSTHKGTPPIDYVYTSAFPVAAGPNAVTIFLSKKDRFWHVRITRT